jgi:uncharacterized UBP type Zn finger protein
MAQACKHLDHVITDTPKTPQGCEECLAAGETWVQLRLCRTCGHVGCCDSSEGKHATKHFKATGHPIMSSMERGDTWSWCYVDEMMLEL